MKHPWANILLLAFIAAELISGFFGLVSGSPDRAIYIVSHRIAGYGLLIVLIWKVAIVLFALRTRRPHAGTRTASLILLALLFVTLGLGFGWSIVGQYYYRAPIGLNWSGVSWHIYIGALLLPIVIWHALKYTGKFPMPWTFWVERRSFLRFASLSVAGLAFWQVGELGTRVVGLSGKDRRFTGSYESHRIDGQFPEVIWLSDTPPRIDVSSWALAVRGMVEHELDFSYSDLSADFEMSATIDCTGGWYSEQVWRGVPLARILDEVGVSASARTVVFTSQTGYYRRFSLQEARDFLLATHVADELLPVGHGFPLRLVAPSKRGFEWVKWVSSIEIDARPKWLQPPLPLQ
jgi:hypothetical protein